MSQIYFTMTDEQIVNEIVNNNKTEYFEILYNRFSSLIYNKCYSFVNNQPEAQDLTQDIFLKLFTKLSSYNKRSKFSTWLYSFVYNYCVNYVNRNPVKKYEYALPEYFDIGNYGYDNSDTSENIEILEQQLNRALQLLSEKDRYILILKYKNDLSINKIQSLLGIGNSAVKMRIKRAKKKLAEYYSAA